MRAYIPSIRKTASKGDKRSQTRYNQISSQPQGNNSNDIFRESPENQEKHVRDSWSDFCNPNEFTVTKKQTHSQKYEANAKNICNANNDDFQNCPQFTMQVGNRINLDLTASTASSSGSKTGEISPRKREVPMTFHFDIDVVKNHVRTIERSQGYDESISKASSSTISTQSTTNQQKYRIANRNVGPSHSKKVSSVQDIFGDFSLQRCEDIWKSHDNDGWTTPIFFNETDNVEKGRNENSWINFAPDSFAPIETTSQNNSFTDINTAPISDSMMTALSSHKARYGTPKTVETDNTYPVREHPKPIQMHPKKFKQEKPHSLSKPINPGISPHSGIHEKTIQEVRKQEPLSKTDVTKPEMSNKTNVSDMQTNASTPKVGKLKQNSHVLNDFLQKKMGDGSTAKPTSNNHGINHQKGQNIQFQDTKTNALLSTMLQKKLASKETSASKPLQKSQIQGETIQSKDTSVLSRILQNRKAGNDTTATLSPKKPQGTLKNVNVVSAPELPCTKSLTMCSDDVTDVEWDDLSGTAFIAALNADEGHAKYSKMLQVGLPIPVVKNAMQRDGIVMRSAKKTTTPAESESNQRFRVQWTVHDNVRCNTLWAMIQRERHWLSNVVLDEEELASWFQKPTVTRTESVRVEPKPQRGIIDPKRANNCGILLATIKMRYAEIARVIDHYDMPALTLTQMHGLWQCLPTAEEAAALQKSGADKSECERFMLEMMRVKNAKVKLEAMLFLKRLPTRLGELQHDFGLLSQAGEEIMTSSILRKILGLVLHLGHRVQGGSGPEVRAITLASLAQLHRAKCNDRGSFLECVVLLLQRHVPSRDRPEFAPTLTRCAGISWMESRHELNELKATAAAMVAPPHLMDAATRLLQEMEESVQCTASVLDQLTHFFGEDAPRGFDDILPRLQQFCIDWEAAVQGVQRRNSVK